MKSVFIRRCGGKEETVVLPEGFVSASGRRYHFELPGMYCDLENGELVLKPVTRNFPAQNVALGFVVSLLYLMVQPRPRETPDTLVKAGRLSSEHPKYAKDITQWGFSHFTTRLFPISLQCQTDVLGRGRHRLSPLLRLEAQERDSDQQHPQTHRRAGQGRRLPRRGRSWGRRAPRGGARRYRMRRLRRMRRMRRLRGLRISRDV